MGFQTFPFALRSRVPYSNNGCGSSSTRRPVWLRAAPIFARGVATVSPGAMYLNGSYTYSSFEGWTWGFWYDTICFCTLCNIRVQDKILFTTVLEKESNNPTTRFRLGPVTGQ